VLPHRCCSSDACSAPPVSRRRTRARPWGARPVPPRPAAPIRPPPNAPSCCAARRCPAAAPSADFGAGAGGRRWPRLRSAQRLPRGCSAGGSRHEQPTGSATGSGPVLGRNDQRERRYGRQSRGFRVTGPAGFPATSRQALARYILSALCLSGLGDCVRTRSGRWGAAARSARPAPPLCRLLSRLSPWPRRRRRRRRQRRRGSSGGVGLAVGSSAVERGAAAGGGGGCRPSR